MKTGSYLSKLVHGQVLADNAENYRGLLDWSQVLLEEGYLDEANRLKRVATI